MEPEVITLWLNNTVFDVEAVRLIKRCRFQSPCVVFTVQQLVSLLEIFIIKVAKRIIKLWCTIILVLEFGDVKLALPVIVFVSLVCSAADNAKTSVWKSVFPTAR